jgi:type VI secretion system secreted protein VgrG
MNLSLQFLDAQDPGFALVSLMFHDEISALFTLSITVQSTNACIELTAVVGKRVALTLPANSVLPRVTGIIREVRVLSTETSGASYYLLSVVPPLWLLTRRVNYRIFQDRTAPEIVKDVIADYGQRVPAPVLKVDGNYRRRPYTAQYGETDYDFVARILADEGIASFFDHEHESRWTLVDPTTTKTPEHGEPIPYVPQSVESALPVPSIQTVEVTGKLKTSVVALQDYDHNKPEFEIKARETADGAELYVDEQALEARHFAVGDVRTGAEADERARRLLEATRVFGRRLMMTINTAIGAGMRFAVSGHPRDDVNRPLLVIRSNFVAQDSASSQQIECIDKDTPFRPRRLPPPRIIGTQTARVVPRTEGKEIDASALGEVMVRFLWDRRDKKVDTSRLVRVSQAWAGQDYGLVCIPRVGDEVVVDFLDGDPDEPIIIGRLHNGVNVRPHNTPAELTVSAWRSRSSPGGDGYNEVLLDDAKGQERLELHAERDYRRTVEHDSVLIVRRDEWLTVEHNKTDRIKWAYSMSAGSVTIGCGPYELRAKPIFMESKDSFVMHAQALFAVRGEASILVDAAAENCLQGATVLIQNEGNSILLDADGITITCKKLTIKSGSTAVVHADAEMTLTGSIININ